MLAIAISKHEDPFAVFAKASTLSLERLVMKNKLLAFWKDESGVTAVEYGLIAGVMAALLVAVLGLFGDNLKALFEAIADTLSDAAQDVKTGNANTTP